MAFDKSNNSTHGGLGAEGRRFVPDLPPRARIFLAEALAYALYDVWMDGDGGDIEISDLKLHAGPRGILTGVEDDDARTEKEVAFHRALNRAVANGDVAMFGSKASEINDTRKSEALGNTERIDPLYFVEPKVLDGETNRVRYDLDAMSVEAADRFATIVAQGGRAADSLVEWENVSINRAEFLAWLHPQTPTVSDVSGGAMPNGRPPFNEDKALALMIEAKMKGEFSKRSQSDAPTNDEGREYLSRHFASIVDKAVRRIMEKLWPGRKKGRRKGTPTRPKSP